jgi:hypothetical protein
MRAIVVDPFKREIREVSADFQKLEVIQAFLADGELKEGNRKVSLTAGPRLSCRVHTYLDDEGYYRPNQGWFMLRDYPNPLAGYMLVLGDDGPEEADLPNFVTIEAMQALIEWSNEEGIVDKIPPVTVTSFEAGGNKSVQSFPVDISDKREI